MIDLDRLLDLVRALNREGVEYVIVGAVALGLHGLARATEDLDLFVRPTPGNVARFKQALYSLWPDPEIDAIDAGEFAGEFPTIRYGAPDEGFSVDIISKLGERFEYDDLDMALVEFEGEPVPVATPRTLYMMKRNTVRALDRADAEALRRAFDLEEE